MIDHQILLNFGVNSPRSVWGNPLKTLSEKYSVKNVNPRKKPHPNRLTLSNARASHLLKKLIWQKSLKVVAFFPRRLDMNDTSSVQSCEYYFLVVNIAKH